MNMLHNPYHYFMMVVCLSYNQVHNCTILKSTVLVNAGLPSSCQFVLDGTHLLHAVVWPKSCSYGEVCQRYIAYMLKHYGLCTTVVFDGYCTISIKIAEQMRGDISLNMHNTQQEKK